MAVALDAGDAVCFNAWGYHRGRYHTDIPRRTLMYTYTGIGKKLSVRDRATERQRGCAGALCSALTPLLGLRLIS